MSRERRWDRRPRPLSLAEWALAGAVLLILTGIVGGAVWLLSAVLISLTGWR